MYLNNFVFNDKMNTLSLHKLTELFNCNSHRILEIYIYKNNIRFINILCEKYLNIFFIDMKTIPLTFSLNSHITTFTLHSKEILYPTMNIYQFLTNEIHHNQLQIQLYQKKRLDDTYKTDIYHPIFFFNDLLLYSTYHFNIENYRQNMNNIMFCISIDDYYLHQNRISMDIYNRYEQFYGSVNKNIHMQEKIITTLLKYNLDIDEFSDMMSKYLKYRHVISSIFQRSIEFSSYHHLQPTIIKLILYIFRSQSDFFTRYENKLYLLFFHISQIRLLLQK